MSVKEPGNKLWRFKQMVKKFVQQLNARISPNQLDYSYKLRKKIPEHYFGR